LRNEDKLEKIMREEREINTRAWKLQRTMRCFTGVERLM